MKVDRVTARSPQTVRPQSNHKRARIEEAQQLELQEAQDLEQQDFAARSAQADPTKASALPNLSQEDLAQAVKKNNPDAMLIAAVVGIKGGNQDMSAIAGLLEKALKLFQNAANKGDPAARQKSTYAAEILQALHRAKQQKAAGPQLSGITQDGRLPMPQMTPQMQQAMMAHFAQQGGMPHNNRMGMHVPHEMNGRMISAY